MAVQMATDSSKHHSFAPLASPDAKVLILGSMPGIKSLEAQQYYAHPMNAFWPVMASLFGIDAGGTYEQRTEALMAHGIGLWDVMKSCERPGSLDSRIVETSIVPNDFSALYARCPSIRTIFFNGARSQQAFIRYVRPQFSAARDIEQLLLPSTSPANARWSVPQKTEAWSVVYDRVAASNSD